MRFKFLILALFIIVIPAHFSNAEISNEKGISIKGEARILTKPDIAYFFLKVDGSGESFELSNKKANEKILQLKEVVQAVLGETPQTTIIKSTTQPKGKSIEDVYNKDFITGMAKAIKGEDLDDKGKSAEKPKEFVTSINVFFSSENFSKDKILKLRALLTEKEIGFDKNNPYGFMTEVFDANLSSIVFGLKNSDVHLDALAAQAFTKAQKKALTVAKAANKKMGSLIGISGCGGELEGTVMSFAGQDLIGKDLGPLSGDPERLSIKFSKTFEFELQ